MLKCFFLHLIYLFLLSLFSPRKKESLFSRVFFTPYAWLGIKKTYLFGMLVQNEKQINQNYTEKNQFTASSAFNLFFNTSFSINIWIAWMTYYWFLVSYLPICKIFNVCLLTFSISCFFCFHFPPFYITDTYLDFLLLFLVLQVAW